MTVGSPAPASFEPAWWGEAARSDDVDDHAAPDYLVGPDKCAFRRLSLGVQGNLKSSAFSSAPSGQVRRGNHNRLGLGLGTAPAGVHHVVGAVASPARKTAMASTAKIRLRMSVLAFVTHGGRPLTSSTDRPCYRPHEPHGRVEQENVDRILNRDLGAGV